MPTIDASIKKSSLRMKTSLRWDQAVLDARTKIRPLTRSIEIFEEMRRTTNRGRQRVQEILGQPELNQDKSCSTGCDPFIAASLR